MKKKILYFLLTIVIAISVFSYFNQKRIILKTTLSETQIQHAKFLKESPFNERLKLSKKERRAAGLPPNKYLEREWELTMNPKLGYPTVKNIPLIQKEIYENKILARVPGDEANNSWVERGPNNVAGRTRAIMFDPNDPEGNTVFAGGVNGGLWKNDNIKNQEKSKWIKLNLPENLNVSCITYDSNNTSIFYLGTGESYTRGTANGNGIWKSTDSGTTWKQVFGGVSGATTFVSAGSITINSPSTIAGDYNSHPNLSFGPKITTPITKEFILVSDDEEPFEDGCSIITNDLTNKIAVIRRNDCSFVIKVKNAQKAGAEAVIIMNNTGRSLFSLVGDAPDINIPSVMISKSDGDLLEEALKNGTVNGTLNVPTGDITGNVIKGIQHINDLVVRNNNGRSEIYIAAADSYYRGTDMITYLGAEEYGVYKSSDAGENWSEIKLPLNERNHRPCPNDIEIDSKNRVWIATTRSSIYPNDGGQIFVSEGINATKFSLKHKIEKAYRTQISLSKTNPKKIYVLAQGEKEDEDDEDEESPIKMIKTTDDFLTVSEMALPNDKDDGIPDNDFTRGQSFYDLVIEVHPDNDEVLYVGGINLFKSTNGGSSWSQISNWFPIEDLNYVHADQHAIIFGKSNQMLFGNDGGVFYSDDNGNSISSRNKGYNITQFYSVGVAPFNTGENFAAGAQDNGTQGFYKAKSGINASTKTQGGDGATTLYDQDSGNYYISNYVYNALIVQRNLNGVPIKLINNEDDRNGGFITTQALDSNLDVLYSDYTSENNEYRIAKFDLNIKVDENSSNKSILKNPLLNSKPIALQISPYTKKSTKLIIGTFLGDLLKVDNANTTNTEWINIKGDQFIGSISDIEFGSNENELFVTMHNYGVVNIWYTNDGGLNWESKEGNLPDLPVKCILQNPLQPNEVIVGTDLGIWQTRNFNDTEPIWKPSFNGMSNVKITDLDMRDDYTVFAATYGRGIFSGKFTKGDRLPDINDELFVYPNPTNGIINVRTLQAFNDVNIRLTDASGKQIKNINYTKNTPNQIELNLENLSNGMYFLTFENESIKETKKIIKN